MIALEIRINGEAGHTFDYQCNEKGKDGDNLLVIVVIHLKPTFRDNQIQAISHEKHVL